MIHLNKNPQALIITVPNEVHLMNTATTGWGGLSLACTVYNIKTGMYMCRYNPDTGAALNLASPYAWTLIQPGHGAWSGATTPFEAYEIPLLEIGTTIHGWSPPHEFATDKYWVNLSEAHQVLESNGTGALPSPVFAPDVSSPPTGFGVAGREGYIIVVHDHSSAAATYLPIDPIYIHLTPDEGMSPVNANVIGWNGNPVTVAAGSNLPNINVADWGDTLSGGSLLLTENPNSNFPNVNVEAWKGDAPANLNPNGLVNANVDEWLDNPVSVSSVNGVPDVNVLQIDENSMASTLLEDFMVNGYNFTNKSVKKVDSLLTGAITSASFAADSITEQAVEAGAIHDEAIADDAIHAATIKAGAIHANHGGGGPAIEADAIHPTSIADEAIHAATIKAGAIHAGYGGGGPAIAGDAIHDDAIANEAIHAATIKGGAIHAGVAASGPAVAPGAIHAGVAGSYPPAIAENAISERSIAIDSVTYEEISDSAIREIVNGIWGASVYSPIDNSPNYSGTDMKMAEPGTIGHTMLMEYLSKFMVHTMPTESPTGVRGQVNTPMHFTNIYDSTGHKFYSSMLAEMNLTEEEAKSYIDRTAVLVRGLTVPSGDTLHSIRFFITESDSGWDGWNGAQLIILDEDGSVVTTETLEGGNSGVDVIDLKAGTDYTFMLTHGGAPAEVGIVAMMWNYETNLWDIPIIVGQNTLQTGPNPLTGSFSTPEESPLAHQQHMVRITDVETDADGQYFRIQCIDEDQSSIPGGIYPTRRDPTSMSGWAQPGDILIVKAETDATMHEVAHEVWEEDVDDHATPDTFGMLNRIIAGLSQYNHQITDSTYDESGRLLACRLVVYPNAEAARNGEDPLTTIEVTSTYDEKQNMVTFKAAEEKEV